MSAQTELMCQIIPVETGNLLIPDQLVEDVVMLEDTDSQNNIIWRGRRVPITMNSNFNKLTTRVSIIKTVMGYKSLPFLAIPTDGIPYPVSVSSNTLDDVPENKKTCSIAAGYARVGSLDCVVVDLPKLESMMCTNLV